VLDESHHRRSGQPVRSPQEARPSQMTVGVRR
jgi:hypothetical protein